MLRKISVACLAFFITAPPFIMAQEPDYTQLDPRPYDPGTEPNIDMYIGSWGEAIPMKSHGNLVEREVLRRCDDPMNPPAKGAVLRYVHRFSHAILETNLKTVPTTPKGEQELFYILSGKGTVTGGGITYPVYQGISFLIPENLEFTMENTGDEPLTMYLVVEPTHEGFVPNKHIVFRNEAESPLLGTQSHWAHICKYVMRSDDGLAELAYSLVCYIAPHTFAQPHSHGPGVEEIWCAMGDDVKELLGKQLRDLPDGTAFLIPPNNTTPHAALNVSEHMIKFFYFARFSDPVPKK